MYENLVKTFLIITLLFHLPVLATAKTEKDATKAEKAAVKTEKKAAVNIDAGSVLTLEQCVSIALKNSPQIQIYQNRMKSAKSQVGIAKSDYSPTFGIGTGYTKPLNGNSVDSNGYSSDNGYYAVNISVQQLLYNFGKTGAKIKSQKYNLEAAGYDLENMYIDTVYATKMAYYNVLAAKYNRDIYDQNVQMNEREYERTKAFFEEGLKSKIDLVNAEVNLSDARIQLVDAENAYQTSLIQLNNSMYVAGAPMYNIQSTETFNFITPNTSVDLTNVSNVHDLETLPACETGAVYKGSIERQNIIADYKFTPFGLSLDDAIKKAYADRPDIKSLSALVAAMNESLKYAKREYFPELTGSAGYTMRDSSSYYNSGFNISAGLNIAAINPFRTKCDIDYAHTQVDLAQNNLDLLKQNVYFEVQSAFVNMQQIEKRIPLLGTKVKQAQENYELADGRYEVGLGNFLELQDAKNSYNAAQLGFVNAVFEYNTARVQVEKAMGDK